MAGELQEPNELQQHAFPPDLGKIAIGFPVTNAVAACQEWLKAVAEDDQMIALRQATQKYAGESRMYSFNPQPDESADFEIRETVPNNTHPTSIVCRPVRLQDESAAALLFDERPDRNPILVTKNSSISILPANALNESLFKIPISLQTFLYYAAAKTEANDDDSRIREILRRQEALPPHQHFFLTIEPDIRTQSRYLCAKVITFTKDNSAPIRLIQKFEIPKEVEGEIASFETSFMSCNSDEAAPKYLKIEAKTNDGKEYKWLADTQGRAINIPFGGESGYASEEYIGHIPGAANVFSFELSTQQNRSERSLLFIKPDGSTFEIRDFKSKAWTLPRYVSVIVYQDLDDVINLVDIKTLQRRKATMADLHSALALNSIPLDKVDLKDIFSADGGALVTGWSKGYGKFGIVVPIDEKTPPRVLPKNFHGLFRNGFYIHPNPDASIIITGSANESHLNWYPKEEGGPYKELDQIAIADNGDILVFNPNRSGLDDPKAEPRQIFRIKPDGNISETKAQKYQLVADFRMPEHLMLESGEE